MIFSCRRLLLVIAATCLPLLAHGAGARSAPKRPKAQSDAHAYKSAIVIDAASGNVLFEDNADLVSAPASMTKLMTFAVLHDKLASGTITLATPVKIDVTDSKMGGTQVFLDPRETFPVEELIYAMMIQSANDAAHALARVSAGSVEGFVELMNAKARELGMKNSTFRSPHGLPPASRRVADGDLTTARDYATLCRYLIRDTDVLKYTSVASRKFGDGVRPEPMQMMNHNKLVGKVAGVDGLKTGFTDAAGYCLSATAERNGRRVIAVIMGSLGPGGQRDLGRTRDQKAIELIERGFAALPANAPASFPPASVAAQPSPNGETSSAASPFSAAPAPAANRDRNSAPAVDATNANEMSAPIRLSIPRRK